MYPQEIKSALQEARLRATRQRVVLLELLAKEHRPMDVSEMLARVSDIDQVTIYRAMDAFVKAGLVRPIDLGRDARAYEWARDDHHHLICTQCQRVEELDACGLEDHIQAIVEGSTAFDSIQHHSFELYGTCRTCVSV